MNTALRRPGAVLAIAALGIAAAACSSSTPSASTGTTTGAAAESSTTAAKSGTTLGAGTSVKVNLKEWELKPSATTAKAGPVTFTAVNDGKEVHELVLFKTDLDPKSLPLDEEGAVDERAAGLELMDEVEDVDPGASKSFTIDQLAPGKYVLLCNTVDKGEKHYGGHQMYSSFTVA